MNEQWIELCPGIRRRTVAHGTTMYQMMAQLDKGATMAEHTHPQEQIMHLLRGGARVVVGGKESEMQPGDSVYVPSNVPHGVREVHEQTFILDTFSPPRDDYLARDREGS